MTLGSRTDGPSYRDARIHLKNATKTEHMKIEQNKRKKKNKTKKQKTKKQKVKKNQNPNRWGRCRGFASCSAGSVPSRRSRRTSPALGRRESSTRNTDPSPSGSSLRRAETWPWSSTAQIVGLFYLFFLFIIRFYVFDTSRDYSFNRRCAIRLDF